MPVDFLTTEQKNSYGQLNGDDLSPQLVCCNYEEPAVLQVVASNDTWQFQTVS